MKFSIILLTYNPSWDAIKATLDSALEQEYKDYEIIISDDGSKENYYNQIKEYLDGVGYKDYHFVEREENVGTVNNVLSAVEVAKGDYIRAFGQGDVFYNKKTLGRLNTFLEDNKCEYCFGLTYAFYYDEKNEKKKVDFYHPFDLKAYARKDKKRVVKNLVLYRDYPPGACMTYEREFFLKYLKKISGVLKYTEDAFQIIAGLDGCVAGFLPEYVVQYESKGGVSNSKGSFSKLMLKDVEASYEYLNEHYGDNRYVKRQRRVAKLYKIKNLYLRTLVRMFIDPSAFGYLVRHFLQTKSGIYKPEHMD